MSEVKLTDRAIFKLFMAGHSVELIAEMDESRPYQIENAIRRYCEAR